METIQEVEMPRYVINILRYTASVSIETHMEYKRRH